MAKFGGLVLRCIEAEFASKYSFAASVSFCIVFLLRCHFARKISIILHQNRFVEFRKIVIKIGQKNDDVEEKTQIMLFLLFPRTRFKQNSEESKSAKKLRNVQEGLTLYS